MMYFVSPRGEGFQTHGTETARPDAANRPGAAPLHRGGDCRRRAGGRAGAVRDAPGAAPGTRSWRRPSRGSAPRTRACARKSSRLTEDPAAIEEVARRELGLIRPGEKVFIIKDLSPADTDDPEGPYIYYPRPAKPDATLLLPLARPDPVALGHGKHEDPAVADFTGSRRLDDRLDRFVDASSPGRPPRSPSSAAG